MLLTGKNTLREGVSFRERLFKKPLIQPRGGGGYANIEAEGDTRGLAVFRDNEKTSSFRDRIDYRETGWLLGERAE